MSDEALTAIRADYAKDKYDSSARDFRMIWRLLDHIEALYGDGDPHDPLRRVKAGEPRFILLARDPLAQGHTTLWAALKSRHFYAAPDIYSNLMVTASKTPFHEPRDSDHAMNARQIANRMGIWRIGQSPKGPQSSRQVDVPALSDRSDES